MEYRDINFLAKLFYQKKVLKPSGQILTKSSQKYVRYNRSMDRPMTIKLPKLVPDITYIFWQTLWQNFQREVVLAWYDIIDC